jgi:hypothetical protein
MAGDVCNTELTWRIDCVSQTRPNKSSFTRLPNHNANKSFLVLAFPTPQQQGDRMISCIVHTRCLLPVCDSYNKMFSTRYNCEELLKVFTHICNLQNVHTSASRSKRGLTEPPHTTTHQLTVKSI